MENEFYIEDESKGRIVFSILFILIIIFVICGLFFLYKEKNTIKVKNNIKMELGTTLNKDLNFYLKYKVKDEENYDLDLSNIPNDNGTLTQVGEYNVVVKYNKKTKKVKVKVEDTTKPLVEVVDLIVGLDEEYDVSDFISKCDDLSRPCGVLFEKEESSELQKEAGEYKFNILISDAYGNSIKKEVKLTVKENYSYKVIKEKDLTIDHISEEYQDYNKEMLLRFEKAIDEEELDDGEMSREYHDLVASDLNECLNDLNNTIESSEVILVYNKYDYVIGVTFRVKLSNGEYRYLSK